MATVFQNIVIKARINKYHIRAVFWVIGLIVVLILMVLLWMFSKTEVEQESEKLSELDSANTIKTINLTNKINQVNDLSYAVKPIEFTTVVRDLRSYPDEFKDKRYLTSQKGNWTIEVMNVEEHDVVKDYLKMRNDRIDFAYFRYTDDNNHQKYLLIYNTFTSLQEAIDASKSIDFKLPKTVKIVPEEISRYASMVDNYERAEAVHDMSGSRPRTIILKKTNRELAVKRVPKVRPKSKNRVVTPYVTKQSLAATTYVTKQSLAVDKTQSIALNNNVNKEKSQHYSLKSPINPTQFVPKTNN